MAYCTYDDLLLKIDTVELVRLTDEQDTGQPDQERIAAAIADADVEIDSYLGEQYTLPLVDPPEIVGKLSTDLAIRNLYQLSQGGVPEHREKQADNAVKMLDKIAAGKLTLGLKDPAADTSDNQVSISSSERLFSRDKMKGF